MYLAPIERICEDVALEILSQLLASTFAVADLGKYPPWVLRQVCRRWRRICDQNSSLWNDICIHLPDKPLDRDLAKTTYTIDSLTHLAGDMPLKLRFYHTPGSSGYVHKPNDIFVRRLIEWIGGWAKVDRLVLLDLRLKFIFKVIPLLLEQPPLPALKTLLLTGRHSWSSGVDADQNISRLIQRCPKLTTISYRKKGLQVMGTGLASPPKVWPQLRSIDLGYYMDVEKWLQMLKDADNLEQAFVFLMRCHGLEVTQNRQTHSRLKNLAMVFTTWDMDCFQPFRLVHLPNLHHLELFIFARPQFTQPYGLGSVLPALTKLTVHRLWHLDLQLFIDFLSCNPQLEVLSLSLSIRFCSPLFDLLFIDHIHTSVLNPALPNLRRLKLEFGKVTVPRSMDNNGGQVTFTDITHQSLLRMLNSRAAGRESTSQRALEHATLRYLSSCPSPNFKLWKKASHYAGMMSDALDEVTRDVKGFTAEVEVGEDFLYNSSFATQGSHRLDELS